MSRISIGWINNLYHLDWLTRTSIPLYTICLIPSHCNFCHDPLFRFVVVVILGGLMPPSRGSSELGEAFEPPFTFLRLLSLTWRVSWASFAFRASFDALMESHTSVMSQIIIANTCRWWIESQIEGSVNEHVVKAQGAGLFHLDCVCVLGVPHASRHDMACIHRVLYNLWPRTLHLLLLLSTLWSRACMISAPRENGW